MNRFPAPIDHCYVLCDPVREPDRTKYLQDWFQTNNVDPSQYSMVMPTYGTDPQFQTRTIWKSLYDPWKRGQWGNFNARNMKPSELSLVLNFAWIADQAIRAGHRIVLILESDVRFEDRFLERLAPALTSLPPRWDFASLSASADLRPERTTGDPADRVWFPPINPYFHTRCTDSMLFRVEMLQKILTTLFPVAEVLDWELNYQLTFHGSVSLWLDPPLLRQGSGKEYETTL